MDCLLLFEYRHSNDLRPERLSLLLGVSIRDFKERFFEYHCQFSAIEGNKMPVSTSKRILAPSLQILAMSLLHIIGELMLPLLVNLLSNDVYNVLQSCLALRMRFFIVTMLIIFLIVPPVTIKEKGLLLPLFVVFKDKRLLLPLFKVFKSRSDPLIEPLIEQCTHSEFTRPDDPLRNDPDVLGIRNMLHSCRDEMLHHSRVQMAQRVHTMEQVPDVEAALRSDYTTYRSRVLHRRVEIGPQTGNLDLDNLSLQIAKAMRRARQIDENCSLQFGSFALLKYKDGELKWWRLQEHWTPIIDEISCLPLNLLDFFTGHRSQWIIRGSNLEHATLEASTTNKKEEIAIISHSKMDSGQDVLLCVEPGLIWRSALLFWRGVYICALNSINDPKKGLDFDLQSESKNVAKVYWTSVAEGLRPSPRTLMFIIAQLLSLGICFSLGYISQGTIISFILSYWWLAAEPGPPIGGLERIPTLGEDLTHNHSATSLPSIDPLLEDISNNPSPAISTPVMPSQEEGKTQQGTHALRMAEYESNEKREIVGQPGDNVPGPPRTIRPESYSKTSCPRSPLLDEETVNIEEKKEATEETAKVTIGEEEQWLAEHKQEEGDSLPSLQMCVPFEDLRNPGNATSLLPEEDESMNSNFNNDEKHKEEGGDVPNPQTTRSTKMWSSNGSHSNDLRNLVSNLRSKEKLWGNGRGLDTDGLEFQELVKDFKDVSHVKELDLVGEDLGDVIISALGKAMLEVPFIFLTSLELGGNSLTDDGVRNIAEAIKKGHLPALESLGLFPFRRGNNRPRFIQREEAQWIRNLIKDEGVKILATAFASGHTSSLKVLTLKQNGISTEGANFLAHEIRRGHLPSLEILNLSYNDVGDEGIEALAVAFAVKGNNLKVLDLETCNIFAEGTKALATAFMSGQFPKLTEVYLGNNHTNRRGNRDGPPSDVGLIELARVLQNGQLPKLQIVDLEHHGDNISRRVAEAFRNAVRSNKSLVLTLKISWPPFSQYEGSVRRALERNMRVATMLQHLNGEEDVPATNGKIFLCGEPQQGKTTLRKSLQRDADAFRTKFIRERRPRYEPRTGIEVSHIVSKGERGEKITLAIWDLAGKSEYNVLHSAFFPDLAFAEGQATTFVIVCDGNYSLSYPRHQAEQSLNYWLRFIASSSIKGDENGKRHVILVLNRFNERPCVSEGLWKRYLAELRVTFHDYLELEELPFVIDARVATSVRPLKEHLIQHTREKLETKRVPKICQFIQDTITEVVKGRGFPVVPWAGFSAMFQCMVSEEQKLKAAADYLNESGHLIIFREGFEGSTHNKEGSTSDGAGPGRSLVVLDPDWFCRKVVGHLLLPDRETMLFDGEIPLTRWVHPDGSLALRDVKDYFRDLLLDEQQVSDIVAMLLRLGICYHVGTDRVLIPALILENNQNPTGSWRKSGMQVVRDQWVMGYCLKVQYKTTTLLPIAVFRRLQVELAQDPICAAADSEYAASKYNITFLTDGMAVLVEISAHEQDYNLEDRVDILVRPLVSREQDRFAQKRKELQVHVAQLIQERFLSLAETWSPGVEFIRLVVKPWSTGEGIIVMEDRNVTLSVEEVKIRVQKSGPQAMTSWIVDGEQVMAIDLLSGRELRELEISVAENCDLVEPMIVELGFAMSEPQDDGESASPAGSHTSSLTPGYLPTLGIECDVGNQWNSIDLHHESLGSEQRQFLESMKTQMDRTTKLTVDQFDKRMDELLKSFQDVRKDLEEVLIRQRKGLKKLQALERFSRDEVSKSVPRFMYLTKGKDTSGLWMTLKDLVVDNATLHFLCEAHYNDHSLHEVEDQEGVEIKNLTRLAAKIEPWLMWSLKVAFVVGKVASQTLLPGLGQLISSFPSHQQPGHDADTATGYWLSAAVVAGAEGEVFRIKTGMDTSSVNKRSTPLRPVEQKDGLRDILKELIGNVRPTEFQSKFKLKRVILNKSSDIVWICNDCFDKYHSRGEVERL